MTRQISLYGLALLTILNLNGALYMWTGGARQVSGVLALCVLGALLSTRSRLSQLGVEYATAVGVFLVSAIACSLAFQDKLQVSFILGPIGSVVLVIATASAARLLSRQEFERLLTVSAWVCGAAAISVLASPWLYSRYLHPPEDITRFAGVFANPNEAAVVCAMGLALGLHRLTRSGEAPFIVLSIVSMAAVATTLSKAGALAVAAVLMIAITAGGRQRAAAVKVLVLTGGVLAIAGFGGLTSGLLEGRALERATELAKLLQLQVDQETSTNRTVVWAEAWRQIANRGLLLGSGLGSMRAIVDGLFENGSWRGVHNWWLMILGEAGVAAFAAMLWYFIRLAWHASRASDLRHLTLAYLSVFAVDSLSSHNLFELRFHSFFLGLVLAALHYRVEGPSPEGVSPQSAVNVPAR